MITKEEVLKFIDGEDSLKELSQKEREKLADVAVAYNLNPLKKEIHFTTNNGKDSKWNWVKIGTPIIAYTSVLAIANAKVKWFRFEWFWEKDVKIIVDTMNGWTIEWEVFFDEFAKTNKNGELNSTWKTMWKFMIRKVALAQAMRFVAPWELSWIYIAEEMTDRDEASLQDSVNNSLRKYTKKEFIELAEALNEWGTDFWNWVYRDQVEVYEIPLNKIKKLNETYKSNQNITKEDIDSIWKDKEAIRKEAMWVK